MARALAFVGGSCLAASCHAPPPSRPEVPAPVGPAPTAPVYFTSRAGSGVSASESPIDDRLANIKVRLEALAAGLMEFWMQHGPDREFGGIHGKHDRRGVPNLDADKGLVQQARHLWSFSTWYARRDKSPEVKAIADDVYTFVLEHFRDKDGEFVHAVSRDGREVANPKKQLYAQSFAIFALAAYADVFDVPEALEHALTCFRSIDARTHDAEHLGYDQSHDPGWLAPGAQKGTNTHIHLLEALTALYRASGDRAVEARLQEMVEVVSTRIVQPSNYAHKEFRRDWRPHGEPSVSYGHDLETSWLLMDALAALDTPQEPRIAQIAAALGEHSAERGYDAEHGGFFEEGIPGGAPTKREKIWWVQAEALPGLFWLYRSSRDAAYLDRLEGTLSWIESRQLDREHGEWFWGIEPDGSIGPRGDHKGEEWKAQYHALRGTVFTADWIDELLAHSSPGQSVARGR